MARVSPRGDLSRGEVAPELCFSEAESEQCDKMELGHRVGHRGENSPLVRSFGIRDEGENSEGALAWPPSPNSVLRNVGETCVPCCFITQTERA